MASTLIRTDSKARSATILTDDEIKDEFGNIEETRKAIERAVNRAHNTKKTNSTATNSIGNDRRFAQALHYEADQLYQKGNYETALVLYHRAAKVCPRDGSHSTAARRTATMINSWQNPSKRLRKFLSKTKPESELTIALCPEVAAIKAANVLRESPDFSSVNEVLSFLTSINDNEIHVEHNSEYSIQDTYRSCRYKNTTKELSFQFSYFDEHKNLWDRSSTTSSFSKLHLTRSNAMLNRLRNVADTTLKKLETAFHSGNVKASFQYAKELLAVSSGIGEPKRYEVEAHRYLALTHVMLGRHDRAVNNVARMVYLAKISNDSVLILQSLLTLGKVHLSFDHLDAAARAWEHLSKNLEEPILRAWIHHEIGRCYLETGKFVKAFNMGNRTLEIAEDIGSNKWILHGKLLKAQTLVKLGRFAEALEELRICARITEEEEELPLNDPLDHENPSIVGIRLTNSMTSLKSEITNATYVIDKKTKQNKMEMKRKKNEKDNVKVSSKEYIFDDNEDFQKVDRYMLKEVDKMEFKVGPESIDESDKMLRKKKRKEEGKEIEEEITEDPEKMIEIIRVALSMSKEEVRSIEKIQIVQEPTSTTTTNFREDKRRNDVGDSITRGRIRGDLTGRSFLKSNR
ncbi:outer dynein arm-docking complex subunit 4-like [Vespa crabro]|uniref:outer dynein arm-docking complex subunit 4-like n=1 Tax=Vespa crabro TaxID=7445 RepID=UPI001F019E29|nr:outer dynein arm-docking complex subunit 4-like [Vespa crabro]